MIGFTWNTLVELWRKLADAIDRDIKRKRDQPW